MSKRDTLLVIIAGLFAAAMVFLCGYVAARYGPVGEVQLSGIPANAGYAVGPGYQMTATPKAAEMALPPGTPTSTWLQPGIDVPCDMADAIARDAASHTCEALWAAERDDPHVQRGLQVEPGNQVSRIHEFGRYTYVLFSQALIVWRNTNDDSRIAVLSPHGCWRALPEPTSQ